MLFYHLMTFCFKMIHFNIFEIGALSQDMTGKFVLQDKVRTENGLALLLYN